MVGAQHTSALSAPAFPVLIKLARGWHSTTLCLALQGLWPLHSPREPVQGLLEAGWNPQQKRKQPFGPYLGVGGSG